MKRLFAHLVFALFTLPTLALQHSCPAVPTLLVDDHVIEGTTTKDETILRSTQVSLYSKGKLVSRATADADGRFTLDNLWPGVYRLSIQRLGNYDVKVVVTAVRTLQQRRYYFFGKTRNGCLHWGFSTN
ncbi:MAG TPA: carboxypeptidase-like regulatory domain-containing protein [Candidatus Binatia bacterium]|nr:carboxypeptidase-like regulatory domain-containing protein [Candidatus Binatia bacterium]